MLTALFAVFLPVRWMAETHEWLGLGEFPESPLVDYLTRSASLLYAWHLFPRSRCLLKLVVTSPSKT